MCKKIEMPLDKYLGENYRLSQVATGEELTTEQVFTQVNHNLQEFHSPATVEEALVNLAIAKGYSPTNCFIYKN